MIWLHSPDIVAFTKTLNPTQKQKFLKEIHNKYANKYEKKLLAGHIANKTFPKEHEILKKGGSISKLFKKGISKIIGTAKGTYKALKRGSSTVGRLVKQHFLGQKNKRFGNTSKRINKNPLTKEDRMMARLAKETYKKEKKSVNGWKHDIALSNDDFSVWNENGRIGLVARGTNPTNMKDLRADLNILTGNYKNDKRFKRFNKFYEKIKKINPKKEFVTVGHSLGSTVALNTAKKYGLKSWGFNPGISPVGEFGDILENPNAKVFIKSGDAISNSALNYDIKNGALLGNPSLNPLTNHTIDNFV